MTTPNTKAVHKHPRGNDLVLSIVLEEASRVVRLLSPNAEEGEDKGTIIEETRAQLLDPSSVKNLQVLLFRQGCKHHITTPAPRIEGGAIVLEIPAEVQQIGTYYVEISYDHEAPQLSDGHMRVTTHAPAVQIVPTSDAPTALDVVVSAHVLPLIQGGNQGGGGLTEEQLMDLEDAKDKATRAIEQIGEVWEGQDTNSLNSAFDEIHSKLSFHLELIDQLKQEQGGNQGGVSREDFETFKRNVEEAFEGMQRRTDPSGTEQTITHIVKRIEALSEKFEILKEQIDRIRGEIDLLKLENGSITTTEVVSNQDVEGFVGKEPHPRSEIIEEEVE